MRLLRVWLKLRWLRFVRWAGFDGKTLWDWMHLVGMLAIPIVVAGGIWWLNTEERRAERGIADERFQEDVLQTYFDTMTTLLLEESLRTSSADDEVQAVAQVRTLVVLRQLNSERKRLLVQFLSDAVLITVRPDSPEIVETRPIITLEKLDLRNVDLSRVDLRGADLLGADLKGANLRSINLSTANLTGAKMSGIEISFASLDNADLRWADLSNVVLLGAWLPNALVGATLENVDLRDAILWGANLSGVDLKDVDLRNASLLNADLSGADLAGASLGCILSCTDLTGATVTSDQLAQIASLDGRVIMPDGKPFSESTYCP